MEAKRELGLPVWGAILLLTWGAAAAFNAGEFIMGGPPTARGTITTLLAVVAWPAAGWFAGARGVRFVRLATAFWTTVVVGIPIVFGTLIAGLRLTVSQGGGAVLLLGFILAAPLYGLAALLPSWGSFEYETLMWTVVIAAGTFAFTLAVSYGRRRALRRSAETPSEA